MSKRVLMTRAEVVAAARSGEHIKADILYRDQELRLKLFNDGRNPGIRCTAEKLYYSTYGRTWWAYKTVKEDEQNG